MLIFGGGGEVIGTKSATLTKLVVVPMLLQCYHRVVSVSSNKAQGDEKLRG